MFVYDAPPMASPEDIEIFCRVHLSEADSERLVGWIAWRTRHNQALAGAGDPLARLRHALTYWLDDAQRDRLLDWLERRRRNGEAFVPGAHTTG
jgi:hypothetical protein